MNSHKTFLIQRISNHLTTKDLKSLVFGFEIPMGRAETITSSIDILEYMEEQALLKEGKYDELRKAMEIIGRCDLVQKIDDYIAFRSENNYGTQEITHSQSSSITSSAVSERQPQSCFEQDGFAVTVFPGTHFTSNDIKFVETKPNNKFLIGVSNRNKAGCFVMVQWGDGNKRERTDAHIFGLNNVTIAGSTAGFVFQRVVSSGLSGHPHINVEIYQEFVIYFQTRKLDGEYYTLSEVMSVPVPKANNGTKVSEVLESLSKVDGIAGSYLYNGEKILKAEEFISFPSNDHSEKHPLLLLKQSEKIAIKRSDSSQIKHIDVDPSQSTLEIIQQRVSTLFNSGQKYTLKVEGSVVVDYMDCFRRKFVEVLPIEVKGASKFRDLGGPSFGELPVPNVFGLRQSTSTCTSHEEDKEELDELLSNFKRLDLPFKLPGKKTTGIACASTSAAAVTSLDIKTSTSAEDKMAEDKKVVFTIFLLPERSSGAL